MAILVVLLIGVFLKHNSVSSLVTDYNIITWNSDGYKLPQVINYFAQNPTLDLAFVQESGNLEVELQGRETPGIIPQFSLADRNDEFDVTPDANEIRGYTIQSGNRPLYVYFFSSPIAVSNKITLTTLSRHRPTEILYFANQNVHRNQQNQRMFTNRPIPGLVFGNRGQENIFLNLHAEPKQGSVARPRNEVPLQLEIIRSYMINNRRQGASWMLIGDYNRVPGTVSIAASERVVAPSNPTYSTHIYDYLIFGSPDQTVLNQMINAAYTGNSRATNLVSDHHAVHFTSNLRLGK